MSAKPHNNDNNNYIKFRVCLIRMFLSACNKEKQEQNERTNKNKY